MSFLKVFFALFFLSSHAYGSFNNPFLVDPELNPNRPRDLILPPIESFFFPGFDQYLEHQYSYGFAYTGLNVLGYTIQTATPEYSISKNFSEQIDLWRIKNLGLSFRYLSSNLSVYHSFRTAVESRKKNGEFKFLTYSESPQELALAPFNIKYITRPTTFLGMPLLGVLLTSVEYVKYKYTKKNGRAYEGYKLRAPTFNDVRVCQI